MRLFPKIYLYFLMIITIISISACSPKINFFNRIGFGLAEKADAAKWASRLGAQWYFDWGTKELPYSTELEYWQTIRVNETGYNPSKEKLVFILKKYPGYTWIIGNEPDNKFQDNTTPEKYAEIYHELYYLIKQNDKTAKVAIAGVSQPTPSRIAYLETVFNTYKSLYGEKLPVDWWNIHAYVLREEEDSWGAGLPVGITSEVGLLYEVEDHGNIQIFQENLLNFRKWLKHNGYQNTPLAVTEYGILLPEDFGFDEEYIADYLMRVNGWMYDSKDVEIGYPEDEYRLIQKFAWFSLSDPNFPNSNLADLDNENLTIVGRSFRSFVQYKNPSTRNNQ
jgi:hypothetical protein